MSSLAAIPASHSQQQDSAKAQKTPDTSGHLLGDTSRQLDLFDAFLKTSKGTSALDSEKSLKTWKASVTKRRGEYSARLESARLISARGSTSWRSPTASDWKKDLYQTGNGTVRAKNKDGTTSQRGLIKQVLWPTPDVAQAQKVSNRPNYGQLGLANHPDVHGTTVQRAPMQKDRLGQPGQDQSNISLKSQESFGKLNPNWVEQLMGLPIGWTDLGSWGTE
tara:strand:+ start:339 stop:1001 length:663 start_codon:yes stop_codon:yes gene_type:complete